MSLMSFNDGNSDAARQFLLDNRCENSKSKRHRTMKRAKSMSAAKRSRIKHKIAVRNRDYASYLQAVSLYWAGIGDHP